MAKATDKPADTTLVLDHLAKSRLAVMDCTTAMQEFDAAMDRCNAIMAALLSDFTKKKAE